METDEEKTKQKGIDDDFLEGMFEMNMGIEECETKAELIPIESEIKLMKQLHLKNAATAFSNMNYENTLIELNRFAYYSKVGKDLEDKKVNLTN